MYEKNKDEKCKGDCLERVLNVEKATFTPSVFLTSGGMSKECKRFVNTLADLIARKRKEMYCYVVSHVRTRLRFTMLRTTLIALRRYRGKKMDTKYETPVPEVSYNLVPAPIME